jgi:superfamily I DNA/RNA helicase
MGIKQSEEQIGIINAVFSWIMLVIAYAGTGKSTTLKNFCRHHKGKTFKYFVFNSAMEKEAKESFSGIEGVFISTFHAEALKIYRELFKDRLEEKLEPKDLVRFVSEDIDDENQYVYAKALLSLLNEFAASRETMDEFLVMMRTKKREWSLTKGVPLLYLLKKLPGVWEEIIENRNMPFEHSFYLKLYQLSGPKLDYDYILVDETQDLNPVMIDIVTQQKHAKIIFVGDGFQSIYSWRGAVDTMDNILKEYDPQVHYLSQSFRCPPKIGLLADKIIKAAGAEKTFKGVSQGYTEGTTKQKAYIARTNSGVFKYCAENMDKKIYFVGGVKKYKLQEILDVKYLQIKRKEFIQNKFIASFDSFKDLVQYANKTKDMALKGSIGMVFKFSGEDDDIFQMVRDIKAMAAKSPKDADDILTTVHKSKGLEWPHVVLLEDYPFGITKKKKKKLETINLREELNLLYVAVTRAQESVMLPEDVEEYIYEEL